MKRGSVGAPLFRLRRINLSSWSFFFNFEFSQGQEIGAALFRKGLHTWAAPLVGPSHTPVPARSSVSASLSTSRAPFSCLPKASSCRHRCAQPSATTSLLVELPLNRIIFGCGYLTIDHRSYYSAFVPYAFRWTFSVVDCNYCVPVLTISC